jgi:hypothetical protein
MSERDGNRLIKSFPLDPNDKRHQATIALRERIAEIVSECAELEPTSITHSDRATEAILEAVSDAMRGLEQWTGWPHNQLGWKCSDVLALFGVVRPKEQHLERDAFDA